MGLALITLNLQAQDWEEVATPPFFKHHSNGFTFDGKAYVFEGSIADNYSRAMWTYDADADEWNNFASFPGTPRGFAIGDEWDGKYYYGFGLTPGGRLNDLWVFDPVDTSFTQLASCPCVPRYHPALAAHEGKIFMGTGSGASGNLEDWWVYDMASDSWSQKANMPGGARHHPFFFTEGEDIFVGGGHRESWYKWNMVNETWTSIDGAPSGRVAGTQFQNNGYGYVLAGDDRFHGILPSDEYFMRYDPVTDEWEKLPPTPNDRWAPSSFIIEDYVYLFGGLSAENGSDRSMIRFDLSSLDPSSSTQELGAEALQLFPNPATGGTFTVNFTTTDLADWNVRFFDVTGRDVTNTFTAERNGEYSTTSKGSFIFAANHVDGRTAQRLVILD